MFLDEISCDGSEETLLECVEKAGPIRAHPCLHSSDVVLLCQGNKEIIHNYINVHLAQYLFQMWMNVNWVRRTALICVITQLAVMCVSVVMAICWIQTTSHALV